MNDPSNAHSTSPSSRSPATRGRLKIFFGAAPGVGKTFAMMIAARAKQAEGVDVVIGDIDSHGRQDLEDLTSTFEALHRDASNAFQLSAALARKPALILLDDIARDNAPGAMHRHRYQDIEDLLEGGIDVYATLSVQQLESMSDVVARISGVRPTHVVPDRLIETADEVALVDLSAEDLLQRVRTGKIQLEHRELQLFKKDNFLALRELALRATADRIDGELQKALSVRATDRNLAVRERVLICVGRGSEYLVRAAKRAATRLKADWIAVYVETPGQLRRSASERAEIIDTLRLAERLGAETITLTAGQTFAEEVLELAHARHVTRIMVGKPHRHGWQRWLLGSVVDALVEGSGSIDVQVVGDDAENTLALRDDTPVSPIAALDVSSEPASTRSRKKRWPSDVAALGVIAVCTVLAYLISPWFAPTNLAMVFLLGVVVSATKFGRRASMIAAIASVAAFDFFFVPPVLTFQFGESQYLLSAAVLLIVGVVISTLAANLKLQVSVATHRERRTAALYRMNREMAAASTLNTIAASMLAHLHEVFDAKSVLLVLEGDRLLQVDSEPLSIPIPWPDDSTATWVVAHARMAGLGTDTYPTSDFLYLPLAGSQGIVGVLAIRPYDPRRFRIPEQIHLLEAFASQIALAVEREQLARHARRAELVAQEEALRSSLLASISHDLRTPLAAITGAASTLVENDAQISAEERLRLLHTLNQDSRHIAHVFTNLLEMTRLESRTVRLDKQWQVFEEIVGAALHRLQSQLATHAVTVKIDPNLPLILADGVLLESLLINLLENAAKYTPKGSSITVEALRRRDEILIQVSDTGPGIPEGNESRLFEKFFRGQNEGAVAGAGLGLSICRAIVLAHNGRIHAENIAHGGAKFTVAIPYLEPPAASPS